MFSRQLVQPVRMIAIILAVVIDSLFSCDGSGAKAADNPRPDDVQSRFAVLIGVQDYPKLAESEQLKGCRNDVEAMKKLLLERFRFRSEDICTLVDSQATSTAIRQQLKRLIDQVQSVSADSPRPQVVFYFSGHGSLMPDQPEGDPDCDKLDGLDQTLVPYDAERQNGIQDIRDDEIHHFAQAVCRDGGAKLLVILDSCHSGRGVRGATRFRGLQRELTVPLAVSEGKRKVTPKQWPSGAVILTACRKAEKEPEYEEGSMSYGLMTRFLVELLTAENALSQLNYETLRIALVRRYQDARLSSEAPTPTLEGEPGLLRGSVLGSDVRMDNKSFWSVEASEDDRTTVRLQAGALHGVTRGSLYELYEKPEQIVWNPGHGKPEKQTSVGWVRIETVEGTNASGTVVEWDGPEQSELIESTLRTKGFRRGFAVERLHQHGDVATRVRVVKTIDADRDSLALDPSDTEVPSVIRETFANAKKVDESVWLTWVQGNTPCDLLLRIDGQHAALFPAIGGASWPESPAKERGSVPAMLASGWTPVDLSVPKLARQTLEDSLRRITRARNVLRIAATPVAGDKSPVRVQVEVVPVTTVKRGENYEVESFRVMPKDKSLVLTDEEDFVVRLKNVGIDEKPAYVTILCIDPDMQIQCILPDRNVSGEADSQQRIEAGAERVTSPLYCTPPFGRYSIVVFATQEPSNFSFLSQSSPGIERKARGDASELYNILAEEVYFGSRTGRTRGSQKPNDIWSASVFSFEVQPRP